MTTTFEWLEGDECIITQTQEERLFGFFGKKVKCTYKYRGSCTVWHHYPSGIRISGDEESRLCSIWTKGRWSKDEESS